MEFLLAHDIGTSGCKTVLVTLEGSILASAYEPYPTRYPQPLWAEQDPQDWWRAAGAATRQVLEQARASPQQVGGLSFSTQMVNALPLGAGGEPLMPCISWLDGRAFEEAGLVMRRLGGERIFASLVGVAMTGKDLLPKYLWLKRHAAEVYRQAAAVVDAGSYLLLRATGRLVYEWSTASVTGLFNLKTKTWDRTLIRWFGLEAAKFPDLVRSTECVGGLQSQAAAELGLLEGTPVFAGAGDAMCAAVGSGATGEGDGHLCLGTSGFVGIVTGRRVSGRRGIVSIQSADPDKLLLIAEMETAGACLKWAARQLYEPDAEAGGLASVLARMDAEVDRAAPGSGGLLFTPWMYGERSPVADESVRAAFINLSANHTRSQMARAIYEGVAYNFRWILESIAGLYGFRPDPLRVLGGGARGLPWLRIIADVTGRSLESVSNPQETSAAGAALIAAIGLDIYPSFEATKPLVTVDHKVTPGPSSRPAYDRLYAAYRQVYPSLRRLYHQLNRSGDFAA